MRRRPAAEARRVLQGVSSALAQVPRAAWVCAAIACLNAACWSIITPPFQVPDEPSHFAYVQWIAETGRLPESESDGFSQEENVALRDLHVLTVRFHPENEPVATQAQQRALEADLAKPLGRVGSGGTGGAAFAPPLYYALQTIPYALGSSGTLLDRLELMRLLGALMAGLTALFTYLFVREALPGAGWAWAVGGLGVALTPLLGFMSGSVSPDAMLYAESAAVFYLLARAFRRGLTPRLGIAIGAATAAGLLTYFNFAGLLPGILVGLLLLGVRAARTSRRSAYRAVAIAVALAAGPICLYLAISALSDHHALRTVSGSLHSTSRRGSLLGEISYIWQYYLPRLPGMVNHFPGVSMTRLWFDRWVGLYGWLDTPLPVWAYNLALIPTALLSILGIRALIAVRATLRRRLAELGVYALMGAGVLALTAAGNYSVHAEVGGWAQPRYLLLLLAPFGAALVLSARGAGRRRGAPVGALIVVLFLTWDVFSQLQVISRFYG